MPYSGGSYVYLREIYGRNTWGRLMAFLFVFQFLVSGPMEVASGFVAMAQYLAYITGDTSYGHHAGLAFVFCALTCFLLYNDIGSVGKITMTLWVGTVGAILFALIAGFANFNGENLVSPDAPFSGPGIEVFFGLGLAARIGIYDFTGYYDVCHIGDEVQNPKRTIPRAVVFTCFAVCVIYFLVYLAVMGFLPWSGEDGFTKLVDADSDSANYIMAIFCEKLAGRGFAIFFTIVVVYTIFGSCFALLLGYAAVPYAAAKDGYFFSWFGHEHPTKQGLADYSLIVCSAVSCIFCFVELETIIEGMLTTRLLVQFIAQNVGLIMYRKSHPEVSRPFKCPLYPLPPIIASLVFFFVFITTSNHIFSGEDPLLELGVVFLLLGVGMYCVWAKSRGYWVPGMSEDEMDENGIVKGFEARLSTSSKIEKETESIKTQMREMESRLTQTILRAQGAAAANESEKQSLTGSEGERV